jgi:hypothetical protein
VAIRSRSPAFRLTTSSPNSSTSYSPRPSAHSHRLSSCCLLQRRTTRRRSTLDRLPAPSSRTRQWRRANGRRLSRAEKRFAAPQLDDFLRLSVVGLQKGFALLWTRPYKLEDAMCGLVLNQNEVPLRSHSMPQDQGLGPPRRCRHARSPQSAALFRWAKARDVLLLDG